MRTVNPGERISVARARPSDASDTATRVHRVPIRCAGPAHLEWLRALAPKLIALRHQYAEAVLDANLDTPEACGLVCERLDGETLADVLRREVRLPLVEARAICRQIAEALGVAHARGIVHGNLCPDNVVFVRPHGRDGSPQIRVRGFGMGPPLGEGLFGTPRYLAPEQVRSQDPRPAATPLSDQFALAVLFSEILSGQPVFQGSSLDAVRPLLVRQDRRHFESPDTTLKDQRRVNRALERALQKAPESRFATPLEFVAELEPRARASSVLGSGVVTPPRAPAPDPGLATIRFSRDDQTLQVATLATTVLRVVRMPVTRGQMPHRSVPHRLLASMPRALRSLAIVLILALAPWAVVLGLGEGHQTVASNPSGPLRKPERTAANTLSDAPSSSGSQNGEDRKTEVPRRWPDEKKPQHRLGGGDPVAVPLRCVPHGASGGVTALLAECSARLGSGAERFELTLFSSGADRLRYELDTPNRHVADAFLRCLTAARSPALGRLPIRGSRWSCR